MNDTQAQVALIKYIHRRIDEFYDEHNVDEFESIAELQDAFAQFICAKIGDGPPKHQGQS